MTLGDMISNKMLVVGLQTRRDLKLVNMGDSIQKGIEGLRRRWRCAWQECNKFLEGGRVF